MTGDPEPRFNEVAPGNLEIRSGRRVAVCGELDLATVASLEAELDRLTDSPLFLDLSGVSFIDSTGLTLLIRRVDRIVLEATSEEVDRVLNVCGLEDHFRLLDPARSAREAQRALRIENGDLSRHALSLEGELASALLALDAKDYEEARALLVRARGALARVVSERAVGSVEPAEEQA
jgi:anti-anti-sigma factor